MSEVKEPSTALTRFDQLWRWTGILLVVALLVIAYLIFDRFQSDSSDSISTDDRNSPLTVNTIVAKEEESTFEIRSYWGVIRPRRSVDLGFEMGGKIESVLVAEGDPVTIGQTLATLDQDQLRLQRKHLDEALARAREDLSEFQEDEQEITTQGLLTRIQQLRTELDQFQEDLNAAQLANQGQPPGSLERLRTVERQIGSLNEASLSKQIDELDRQVEELDDKLAELDLQIEKGILQAPFDGVVAIRHLSEGAAVSPGSPVVRLVEESRPQAWVGLPVGVVSQIQVGQAAWMTVENEVYSAVATAILPQLDQSTRSRTVVLEVEVLEGQPAIVPGQVVEIQFWIENPLSGVWVPITALHREVEGLWSVFVAEQDEDSTRVVRRYIDILRLDGDFALVSGTIEEGESILVDGGHRVVAGQSVSIKDVTATLQKPGPGEEPGT